MAMRLVARKKSSPYNPMTSSESEVLMALKEEEEAATKKKFMRIRMKLWSGDTGLPEMTTKSRVRPILIVNGLVLLRISTSTHRSSRSTHSLELIEKIQCKFKLRSADTRLREITTKTGLRPTFTITSSVVFWTSTRELRKSCGRHFCNGDTRLRERKTKTVLRLTLTVTSSVVLWTSTRELRKFHGDHSCKLICEVGILACERGKQRRSFDRLLQLLVQLCFGLRRGNLENFTENIPASIKEHGDTRLREKKTKVVLRLNLTVTSSVVLWTSTRELRKFHGEHSCKLICEVGILACERGKQRRSFHRLLQLLVQLCFGLRRGNLENFTENIPAMALPLLAAEVSKEIPPGTTTADVRGTTCWWWG
ncbi:hypothetical protein HZH68_010981 [Vespula germanica]|uniref:Uncharacterized protein n=1 Tax=Vespula germanica TaxID=30212 RepID=A0A834JM74_VESGE|nr:hypothetical protein HZH68_010981 [Vespula germanica]